MSGTTSPYPVIYAFGDSLSDAGDAYLLTSGPAAQAIGALAIETISPTPVSPPYYAASYALPSGGTLTADVFSNGPVWVQQLATDLGINVPAPATITVTPATLEAIAEGLGVSPSLAGVAASGLEALPGNSSTGIVLAAGVPGGTDFAIGGSVTGPTAQNTGPEVALTDLSAQYSYFQADVPNPAPGALYTVWSGSNDLIDLVEADGPAQGNSTLTTAETNDIAVSVNNEVGFVTQLIDQSGAQNVLVLNVPDLSMVPEIVAAGLQGLAGAASTLFDTDLSTLITADAENGTFGTARVSLEDTAALIDKAVANPAAYGLTNVTTPAYSGSGYTTDNGTVTDASTSLFFDMLHPTTATDSYLASTALTTLGVTCFAHGTRIATVSGEVAVEHLAVGDRVLTATGEAKPIRWIGRRSFAGRFLAANPRVLPIRFTAGSLGGRLPRRDLLVSPCHALFLDGVLVPAECLVNATTIRRERGWARVDYVHIELDDHDLILAEGAPTETFLDDDSRMMFHNAAEFAELYPDALPPGTFCAPRVESGAQLERIRDRLAGTVGWDALWSPTHLPALQPRLRIPERLPLQSPSFA